MSLVFILIALTLSALSGMPGVVLGFRSSAGERIAARVMVVAAALGLAGAGLSLAGAPAATLVLPSWFMGGDLAVMVDPLSAIFLVPVFLMGGLGAIYGLGYWPQARHPANGRRLRLFWGLLICGMALLLIARHALAFILGWEFMALSAFFLVGTEDHNREVRGAAWLYLLTTHVGTLSLFALFILWRVATGSFALTPLAPGVASAGLRTAIFLVALVAFGLKAGLMPLHFWLPPAHANAPSHVSAILSGVVLKTGVYGLVRLTSLLPDLPVAWGGIVLVLGCISGVLGVALAVSQHDLKRLLAYHSVENVGIIVMGLGLAMIGRSLHQGAWIALGMAGCLLHVWNHALFKSLLFLGAGSVVHACRTREIDALGGLARRMPWTSALFLVGAVAICGLPPLNGFVSELMVYLGLLRTVGLPNGTAVPAVALGVPALALIGALALACFVKVYGAVFLGAARTALAEGAHEAGRTMIGPMIVLAGCCAFIGLVPAAVAPLLDRAIAVWSPAVPPAPVGALVPLGTLGLVCLAVLAMAVLGWVGMRRLMRQRGVDRTGTWDCGYARPTARMQYTASSFARTLVELFAWALPPRRHPPDIRDVFLGPSHFESHVEDPVFDRQLVPAGRHVEQWLSRLRVLQRGLTQHYVLYILVTVIALLVWTTPVGRVLSRLLAP